LSRRSWWVRGLCWWQQRWCWWGRGLCCSCRWPAGSNDHRNNVNMKKNCCNLFRSFDFNSFVGLLFCWTPLATVGVGGYLGIETLRQIWHDVVLFGYVRISGWLNYNGLVNWYLCLYLEPSKMVVLDSS
jgi:hypothetical protein